MNIYSALTTETQVCICIVLVLLIVLVSGVVGWRMGWVRCVEYIESLNMNNIITERGEYAQEDQNAEGQV
uniref:Uncharacterized protein n=1 Tax=viral metagenome TaxID=1070528 RepID=A0A6M3JHW6_9ZZZZ